MKQKLLATLVLVLLAIGGVWFATTRNSTPTAAGGKLQVVASYYPLYDFARQVGGNLVNVTNVTPAGAEPHDYEPSPRTLATAQAAPVFIYNGASQMEPWAQGFLAGYRHTTIKASSGIALQQMASEDDASNQAQDPHFWLDPVLAQQIVANIRDGLSRADPTHAAHYAANATAYLAQLRRLDHDFAAGLQQCQTRTFITSHAAFGYLAQRYHLDVRSIAGLTPDEEPSASKLAELTNLMRTQNLHYIFFESLVSPRLAATIATETGAKTLVFDPIEGVSERAQAQGQNYLSIQRQNLANLRIAGTCR